MEYAGFSKRLLAHNIDLLPLLGLFYLCAYLLPRSSWDWLVIVLIYIGYHSIFEWSKWKATPGKRWSQLMVVTGASNHPNSMLKIVLRNGLKIISLLAFFSGFIMILFHPKKQSLHDLISGTSVINKPN